MAEYIERQAVMDKLAKVVVPSNHSDFERAPTWNDAVDIIENFPPADVRPVVHGHWTVRKSVISGEDYIACSECLQEGRARDRFCPNCAADMRGGDAE